MLTALFGSGSALLLVLLVAAYLWFMHRASRHAMRPRKLSEAELLAKIARIGPHSEYDLFHMAAGQWRVPKQQVEADFRTYLLEESLPHYVNGYLRLRAQTEGDVYRPPFVAGGGPLPWIR